MEKIKSKPKRSGPDNRLSRFYAPTGAIEPLPTRTSNDQHWFSRYGGFIVRDSWGDENCLHDLNVESAMAAYLQKNIEKFSKTELSRHFVTLPGFTYKVPPFPPKNDYAVAISISKALMKAAKDHPKVVRSAVSAYVQGVRTSDRLFVLNAMDQAPFGRDLIELIRLLQHLRIKWRVVRFRTQGQSSPFQRKEWLIALGLPSNTKVPMIAPKNLANPSNVNQIAIEVVEHDGKALRNLDIFYSVMLFARIVEIWRFISPIPLVN